MFLRNYLPVNVRIFHLKFFRSLLDFPNKFSYTLNCYWQVEAHAVDFRILKSTDLIAQPDKQDIKFKNSN